MSGKRLLDLAALFNASRGVAQKHVALRARQLDVYNRTSTLAAAVRNQTVRVTETAKAARTLAERLNESKPAWAEEDVRDVKREKEGTLAREDAERSGGQSAVNEPATDELEVRQEEAARDPLPDGTIPLEECTTKDTPTSNNTRKPLSPIEARTIQRQAETQIPSRTADAVGQTIDPLVAGHDEDSFYKKFGHTSPTLSSLPRVKIPKNSSDIQEGDSDLEAREINSESFYQARGTDRGNEIPSIQVDLKQEETPEGINTEVFRSPRVAKLLGSSFQRQQNGELRLNAVQDTPRSKVLQGRDQDTFNVTESSQEPNSPNSGLKLPVVENESIERLAEEISEQANKVDDSL